MKVTAIKTYFAPSALSSDDWCRGSDFVLVKVETDAGVDGSRLRNGISLPWTTLPSFMASKSERPTSVGRPMAGWRMTTRSAKRPSSRRDS